MSALRVIPRFGVQFVLGLQRWNTGDTAGVSIRIAYTVQPIARFVFWTVSSASGNTCSLPRCKTDSM